jgi:NAD(P)-dependent dehydrogenase (short-subunit alcohol dehydrogenase family)
VGKLDGAVVLITGGGSGLVQGLLPAFLDAGANIVLVEHDAGRVRLLSERLPADRALVVQADVTDLEQNDEAVARAVARFGRLDSLIAAAAVADRRPGLGQYQREMIGPAYDEVMDVNVKGYLMASVAAIPELRKTRGSIVFTLSTAGFFAGATGPMYTVSKHALVGLLRHLAYEFAPDIRVNGVVPGAVAGSKVTAASSVPAAAGTPDAAVSEEAFAQYVPLGFIADAEDYADIFVLLASTSAKAATGSIVFWDGGVSMISHGRSAMDTLRATPPRW